MKEKFLRCNFEISFCCNVPTGKRCEEKKRCVKKIVTELAELDVTNDGFKLLARAPGVSVKKIKRKMAGKLIVEGEIPETQF